MNGNGKTKALMVVPVLAGVIALGGWQGCCHHGSPDPAQVSERVTNHVKDALEDLKATPDQTAKVLALKDSLLKDGLAMRSAQKDARTALLGYWDEETPDPAKVHALIDARIDALRTFAHEAANAGLQLHGILTPEQRAQVSKKLHRLAANH